VSVSSLLSAESTTTCHTVEGANEHVTH
jgi:hypothetical protein